jgi:hypothetical protein
MNVTTTSARQGKFETRFWHKIFEEEVGRVKGHFGPINTYVGLPLYPTPRWNEKCPLTQLNMLTKSTHTVLPFIQPESSTPLVGRTALSDFTPTTKATSNRGHMEIWASLMNRGSNLEGKWQRYR